MNKVKMVTGYCPLPILNVSEARYRELGQELVSAVPFDQDFAEFAADTVERCWAYRYIKSMMPHPAGPVPPDRFPDEWTACCSAIVNINKTRWLTQALDDGTDIYVWIDYGILKQQGMLPEHVTEFLRKVETDGKRDEIVFPGLVDKADAMSWATHHTRFCGSVLIVPRQFVVPFHAEMTRVVHAHVHGTGTLSYDVNYFAAVERNGFLPFRQYRAWWDQTQFTAYEG